MNFQPMNFIINLKYMGMGMLGICIVIGIIAVSAAVLNMVFKHQTGK